MLVYLGFRLAAFLVRNLPERWGCAIARWLGAVIYRVSPLAEAGRDNMRHVLGPDADAEHVSDVTRQAFQERLLNYHDMFWFSNTGSDPAEWHVQLEGIARIEELAKEGRGAVLASVHIGPVERMMHYVTGLGYPFIGIAEHLENERLHQYIISLRRAHGLNLISTKGSLLEVFRQIRRGGILFSAADRDSTDTGLVVDFFGAPAWMPDGYARVAVRARVPVVFGYSWRTDNGVEGVIYPPMYPDLSLGKEEAVKDLIERTLRLAEEAIGNKPEMWHLSTPVWRLAEERREEGAPS